MSPRELRALKAKILMQALAAQCRTPLDALRFVLEGLKAKDRPKAA